MDPTILKPKDANDLTNELKKIHSSKATLAIMFSSVNQDYKAMAQVLDDHGLAVFGATTSGEFIDDNITEGSTIIMLLNIDKQAFRLIYKETGDTSTYENSKLIGAEGKELFSNPAFIIASGWLHVDGEEIPAGIIDGFGKDVTIFGGMAGDDLKLEAPIAFTNGQASTHALLALVIDKDKIDVRGVATCGWKAIGTTKTVTKSKGNVVYTIDDRPALDMVLKYLGLDIDLDSNEDVVTNIGSYYPLQLERDGHSPVIRTAMFTNKEERSLICAGNVPQGSKVRFSLPPDFDSIDTVVEECNSIKDHPAQNADALIMFSCISRRLSFGLMMSEELEQVKKVWNAPLIGFFSYGEFGKSLKGKHEFHNNTCCIVALTEK